MGIILISTMIAIGIATTIINNYINIALAQPAEEGRPSPPAHPSPSTGHPSYPSSQAPSPPTSYNPSTGHSTSSLSPPSSSPPPQLAAKQPTKVNPMPAENITASAPSHFTSSSCTILLHISCKIK